jgi:hypothetical protein
VLCASPRFFYNAYGIDDSFSLCRCLESALPRVSARSLEYMFMYCEL